MLEIPLRPLPNQTFQIQLADQACTLRVYQFAYGLFMDVIVDDALIIGGVICENLNRIVRSLYLGFVGDFVFVDTQSGGKPEDPIFTGLGDRFRLVYLEAADLPAGEG